MRIFTSESVSSGHPDKIADQISDAVLDEIIAQDQNARVACEVLIKGGLVLVSGEITTNANVDIETIARRVICDIGYSDSKVGFDGNTCAILTSLSHQSPDIAYGVNRASVCDQGAGDQGMVFGYASNETENFMPAPIAYAHSLMRRQEELRKMKEHSWLRPDAKSQVSLLYEAGIPVAADTIVFSTQHSPEVDHKFIEEFVMEQIVKYCIPENLLCKRPKFYVNPTGKFIVGGPAADCGLTGRKIIIDTYGGMARHGGGAFSGKDPSKTDRSACYMARYIALNIVAAGLAKRCEIQIAYAIGIAEPVAIAVETFGTGRLSDQKIATLVRQCFDLTPYGITRTLDLLRPIYFPTAKFGHFGRVEPEFTWEQSNKVDMLIDAAGIKTSKHFGNFANP